MGGFTDILNLKLRTKKKREKGTGDRAAQKNHTSVNVLANNIKGYVNVWRKLFNLKHCPLLKRSAIFLRASVSLPAGSNSSSMARSGRGRITV